MMASFSAAACCTLHVEYSSDISSLHADNINNKINSSSIVADIVSYRPYRLFLSNKASLNCWPIGLPTRISFRFCH